jgi:hypothetical protein
MAIGFFIQVALGQGQMPFWVLYLLLALAAVIAVPVAVHRFGMHKDLRPPKAQVPRKRLGIQASQDALLVALCAAYTIWWPWLFVLYGLIKLVQQVVPNDVSFGLFLSLSLPVPLIVMLWAFLARRRVALEILKSAQPPELQLTTDLLKHVKELQARAEAFDKAMEEVTAISNQVQRKIEAEQQKLDEIREQHSREAHLKDLTADEIAAIRAALAQEFARGQRRGWWSRILFGVIAWAFGVASQALIDMDALGDQLRQWWSGLS